MFDLGTLSHRKTESGDATPLSIAMSVCGILELDAGEYLFCARSGLLTQIRPSDSRLTTIVEFSVWMPFARTMCPTSTASADACSANTRASNVVTDSRNRPHDLPIRSARSQPILSAVPDSTVINALAFLRALRLQLPWPPLRRLFCSHKYPRLGLAIK